MSETKTSPQISLGLTKQPDETWRECALRYGRAHGLEIEVADAYASYIASGSSDDGAAFGACSDWDVLSLFENGVEKKPPDATI